MAVSAEQLAQDLGQINNRGNSKKLLTAVPFCTINSAGKPSEEDDSVKVLDMAKLISISL